MQWPTIDDFREVRRALPVVAAVLFVGALLLPMWVINVHVVQYPDEVLHLQLYAYPHIAGDYVEMAGLNQYIGFYYPDPVLVEPNFEVHERAIDVPEWSLGPLAFIVVAATGLFVAVAPTLEKLKRGLKWQLIGTVTVFTVMLVDIQYRLYQAGHTLDPDAPVIGVESFTPPIWGKYEVANITSYSRLGMGAYVTMVSIGLLIVAYYYRNEAVHFGELPGRLSGAIDRLGEDVSPEQRDEEPPVMSNPERSRSR